MRLWTIQTTDIYNMIQKNDVYHCDERLSFANDAYALGFYGLPGVLYAKMISTRWSQLLGTKDEYNL